MVNIKIIFLIALMLSVAYVSAMYSGNEDSDGFDTCINEMTPVFGLHPTQRSCVKTAISNMKLFGEFKDKYDVHVRMYYASLHLYVKPGNFRTPKEFCAVKNTSRQIQICEDKLVLFQNNMGFDDQLPGLNDQYRLPSLIQPPQGFDQQPQGLDQQPLELSTDEYNFLYGHPSTYTGGIEDLINPNQYSDYQNPAYQGSFNPDEQNLPYSSFGGTPSPFSSFGESPAYSSFGDLSSIFSTQRGSSTQDPPGTSSMQDVSAESSTQSLEARDTDFSKCEIENFKERYLLP